jgi:hypothetical protein
LFNPGKPEQAIKNPQLRRAEGLGADGLLGIEEALPRGNVISRVFAILFVPFIYITRITNPIIYLRNFIAACLAFGRCPVHVPRLRVVLLLVEVDGF